MKLQSLRLAWLLPQIALSPRARLAAAITLVVVLAAALFAFRTWGEHLAPPPSLPVIADLGGDFELAGAANKRIHLHDYRGRVVLLFFGYMHCPDVCPTTLATLKLAVENLGSAINAVQVIMISVDPERDSPDDLEQYVGYFHPKFVGLSGTVNEIDQVAKQYRVYREKVQSGSGGYTVSHSGYVYLLDKQGKVRALFGAGADQTEIADGVRQLL